MKKLPALGALISRIVFLYVAGFGCLPCTIAANGHWVGTWGCGPQLVNAGNTPPVPLAFSTLRQFVPTTIGGQHLRVRFSNAYGTNAVVIQSAHVALASGPLTNLLGAIDTTADKALTFRGGTSVTIPPGEVVFSDPCDFNLPALTNLAVSIYFGNISSTTINGHPGSRSTSYIQSGNTVSMASMPSATQTLHWYIITGVDVLADSSAKAVVALGDSITDGRGPADNVNNRWPDFFAAYLATNPPTSNVGVLNMGIGANDVLVDNTTGGPGAVNRFDRDVLSQSGVRWLIVFEGVNDIGGSASATNLITAYTQFATKAHARGLLAYGATITPFGGNGYYTPAHEATRQAVNAWFRTNTIYDGVIDFDKYVRDPVTLTNFQAAFFAGPYANDWLHMNAAGYQTMATNIDLSLFTR